MLSDLPDWKLEELNGKVMNGYHHAMIHSKRKFHDTLETAKIVTAAEEREKLSTKVIEHALTKKINEDQ